MPINLVGNFYLPLTQSRIERLWQQTIAQRQYPNEQVNIRAVTVEESQTLNKQYRQKNAPTNVLTFSYNGEHDVAVCAEVVKQEAGELRLPEAAYAAWVLVHAFVHATGLDHESSSQEANRVKKLELSILAQAGYDKISIWLEKRI